MILPQALLARWRSTMGFYSCAVPSFEQLTLTRFLDGGYFERHVSRMKKHYKARLQGLLALLGAAGNGAALHGAAGSRGASFSAGVPYERARAEPAGGIG